MTPEMLAILRKEILTDPAKRGYDPADADKTAALLNVSYMEQPADIVTTNVPLRWGDVHGIAQAAGEWPNIVLRAEERPATDTVKAAINARSTTAEQVIDPADPKAWGAFQAGLGLFVASGDLSQETVDAILALSETTVTPPPVEQHARIMEIFIADPVPFPDDFLKYEATADDVKAALA